MKLQSKILCFVFSLGLFSTALTIWIFQKAMNATLTDQLAQIGLSEARELAEKTTEGVQTKSETMLLKQLLQSQKIIDASYIAALDRSGRVLAHTDVTEKGKVYNDLMTQGMMKSNTRQIKIETGKQAVLRISVPVWMKTSADPNEQFLLAGSGNDKEEKERIGTICLGVSLEKTHLTGKKIVHQLAAIMGLIGLMTLLSAIWLIRGVLGSVRLLQEGTATISKGEYGTQIAVSRKDELGQLASDFNQMSRILADTTDRMSRVLAETTASKNFMKSILASMGEPLLVIGTDGNLQMCNQATLRLLGYAEEELIEKPVSVLCGTNDGLREAGTAQNVELIFITKKGEEVPVLYSSSPLTDNEGHSKGLIVIARDMTERKRLEIMIRRSEKLSAVGQLAAGVAHEINNPLGVIMGYAQALVRRVAPGDALEVPLRSIEREAVRCKNLVQDLLTFSRVSKVEREPMDLNKTVLAALSLVTAQAKMSQVTVQHELADNLPRVLGNPNQVQQVVINLATNAIDAMGNSGILKVKTELIEEGPLSWVGLKMIDTGSGVLPELLTKIFEPFFTTKDVGKGTGLGLSLVHEIVKKHSGMIDVQSRPGHTEFCVKFPVRTSEMAMTTQG
jgi:PAS domain S-box-containing protein